jgi:hypothetical protein
MSGHEVELDMDGTRFEVRSGWYTVRGTRDRHRVELVSPDGDTWLNLSLLASAHRTDAADESYDLAPLDVSPAGGGVRISAAAISSAWDTHVVELDCLPAGLLLRLRVEGIGALGAVTLAGGDAVLRSGAAGTFRSGGTHDTVFSPAPSEPVAPLRPAAAAVQLGVVGDAEPGRLHGLFSPPPLVVGLGRRDRTPGMPWLGLGLVAPVERCTFTTMRYEPLDGGFLIRLDYEGHTAVAGEWASPDLSIRPAEDPYEVIDGLRDALEERGLTSSPRPTPRWALEPIFCGWGAQCAAAVRAGKGGDPGLALPPGTTRAADLARADLYDGWLAHLDNHGVRPGTIVIDDRWQAEYGTNRPDESKWPDLRGWIADRHRAGQRVMLWFKAWDPEGLPEQWCVRTPDGRPVAVDPGNPDYLAELERQVHAMLSPDGLDADGFKVDFTQRAPSGAALTCAADPLHAVWGVAALHRLLAAITRAAHRAKPDAVVITHAVDPRFGDVGDMVRLNDVLERDAAGRPVPVVDQVRHRAEVARRALPGRPLDTDQWPMPNREQWRTYATEQPKLGVPALYYATSIDNSDEDLTADDLRRIADLWAAYQEALEA